MATIQLNNISFYYPTTPQHKILDDVSILIDHGHIAALIGQSGSGKSTLLRVMAGFEQPTAGSISINAVLIVNEKINVPTEKRHIGMIFQDYSLFPHLTAAQNIGFGLGKLPKAERAARVDQLLGLIKMDTFGKRYPYEISGGQQQRVAIARALATQPAILLLDEPFSNLDPELRVELRQEVKRILRQSQTTTLFVTHDSEEAKEIGDQVLTLSKGRLLS